MTRRSCISVDSEVTVDVWPEDLEAHGYHHEDDCPARTGKACAHPDMIEVDAALDELHRAAGHGEFPVYVCTQEPCRALYLVPRGDEQQAARKRVAA